MKNLIDSEINNAIRDIAKLISSDEKQIKKVRELNNNSLTFNFIDIRTKKGKKSGWSLKNYWGAALDPFAIVSKNEKPIKAFYSESENEVLTHDKNTSEKHDICYFCCGWKRTV